MEPDLPAGNYRWFILALAAATFALCVGMPTMCLPVLFQEISDELGLSLVEVGAIWGMGYLPGLISGLVGGTIGDRFGTKRTLVVFCLLAGLTGASRGLSTGFLSFAVTALLYGFLFTAIPTNIHKVCGVWFSGKRLGLANGVVAMGMAFGFMAGSSISASLLSPWLGGWRNVLFFYGLLSALLGLTWALTRTAASESHSSLSDRGRAPWADAIRRVLAVRNIWLLGVTIFGFNGCVQGMLGYLPLYLRLKGWQADAADNALATFHGASMAAVILIVLVSDRFGRRKPVLMIAATMMVAGTALLSVVEGWLVWVAVILAGFFRDGFMAVYMTTIIETRRIGASLAGTAIGVVLIFSSASSLLSPPMGNALEAFSAELPFVFWAGLGLLGLAALVFVEEEWVDSR